MDEDRIDLILTGLTKHTDGDQREQSHQLFENDKTKGDDGPKKKHITLLWVSGHMIIPGNKQA
jgi:hypothetical protein